MSDPEVAKTNSGEDDGRANGSVPGGFVTSAALTNAVTGSADPAGSGDKTQAGDFPVLIGRYPSNALARIDASFLMAVGIDAEVHGELSGVALSYYGNAVRQITLVVPSRQADEAIQLLKEAARSRPAVRDVDWVCSDCKEVNGPEFDACWSCGKEWNKQDEEFEPDLPIPSQQSMDVPEIRFPALNDNPYAPPVISSIAVDSRSAESAELIRRIQFGLVASCLFPPMLLLCVFMSVQAQLEISSGKRSCSPAQRRQFGQLTFASVFASILFSLGAYFIFIHHQRHRGIALALLVLSGCLCCSAV